MRARMVVIALLCGLMAGCAEDRGQTSSRRLHAAVPDKARQPLPMRQVLAQRGLSDVASLPDRGEFMVSDLSRASVRRGAQTFHPVQLSEEHALMAISKGEMVIPAPNGQPIRLRYERHVEHADGNWTWIGRSQGSKAADAIVTFGEKAVFGSIPYGDEAPLQLMVTAAGSWLIETDRRLLGKAGAIEPSSEADFLAPLMRAGLRASSSRKTALRATASKAATSQAIAQASAANTVDLVLGYSSQFSFRYGGRRPGITRLNYLVDLTNLAYTNSQLDARVRLVRTVMVEYPDYTSNTTALFELTGVACSTSNASDLRLPDRGVNCTPATVPAALRPLVDAREQAGADLVALVRKFTAPENGSCGVGWLLGGGQRPIDSASADFAFSVVSDSGGDAFPDEGITCREEFLAHELGHNMGLQHDRATAQGSDDTDGNGVLLDPEEYGRYPYAFGYTSGSFYTIMSPRYVGQTGFRYFSNPRISICAGSPCGVENEADNVRALEQTIPLVAAFRATAIPLTGMLRRDYDNDGRSDFVWRNSDTGDTLLWWHPSGAPLSPLAPVSIAWTVAGIGDFDGDNHADLLWRNAGTGANVIWRSANHAQYQTIRSVGAGWIVAAVGDFDGDGSADLLWRNASTGVNVIWRSASASTAQTIRSVGAGWTVAGATDFNGDGSADLLWRNPSTGVNVIWRSANANTAQVLTSMTGAGWGVAGVGDFNGDGRSDIFWRNSSTGANVIWRSANSATTQTVKSIAIAWIIPVVDDYDGDGSMDLLWRNTSTGVNVIWRSANPDTPLAVGGVGNMSWSIMK